MLTSTRLLEDGKYGDAEHIQTFRGLACRSTFTSRRNTPLYRLKTSSPLIAMVLSALAEVLDPSAAERVFATDPGAGLFPTLYERRTRSLFLCPHGPLWSLAPGRSPRPESTSVASGNGVDCGRAKKSSQKSSGGDSLRGEQAYPDCPISKYWPETG